MVTTDSIRQAQAKQVTVTAADGVLVPGWVIRKDVVVTQAGGLRQPISVIVGGAPVQSEKVLETKPSSPDDLPWTALELPSGTFDVAGDHYPPVVPEPIAGGQKGSMAFWCYVFPGLRGCR